MDLWVRRKSKGRLYVNEGIMVMGVSEAIKLESECVRLGSKNVLEFEEEAE